MHTGIRMHSHSHSHEGSWRRRAEAFANPFNKSMNFCSWAGFGFRLRSWRTGGLFCSGPRQTDKYTVLVHIVMLAEELLDSFSSAASHPVTPFLPSLFKSTHTPPASSAPCPEHPRPPADATPQSPSSRRLYNSYTPRFPRPAIPHNAHCVSSVFLDSPTCSPA